jgi:1,2-diacylglycerol 3-alpha-glucosyltransferase
LTSLARDGDLLDKVELLRNSDRFHSVQTTDDGSLGAADRRQPAPRVLLACCGLEHAQRGYETFARSCFEALRREPGIDIELVKGSGPSGPEEHSVSILRRDRSTARFLGRAFGFRPFRLEALAFAVAIQPMLTRFRPDVVYLSEWDTAKGLARIRFLTRQRFRIVLCNGGFAATGFDHLDHVQQLTPGALEYVLARGADRMRHSVLPLGFDIEPDFRPPTSMERTRLREDLRLPTDREILLSVAALNRSHKRIDYLIDELGSLQNRPYAVFIGESDSETSGVRALADKVLERDGYCMRTVPAAEVRDYLRASDAFVLASLEEAQGRAVVEAMAEGVPCILDDNPVMRFAAGEFGLYRDLSRSRALSDVLTGGLPQQTECLARERHRFVYDRFSWSVLSPQYIRLFRQLTARN